MLTTSAAAENILKPDELDAEFGCDLGISIGIVGDEPHVERSCETEQLGADVTDAHRAKNAADQSDAHVFAPTGEAGRAFARQRVLDDQLTGERQHECDDRDRYRPADAVRRDDKRDACSGAGLHVDGVVPDAETRHDGKPAVGMECCLG